MARPLSTPDTLRNGTNGTYKHRGALAEAASTDTHGGSHGKARAADAETLDALRQENAEYRSLCKELETALQESSQQGSQREWEERILEYDALLEEKNEVIRKLHQDLQSALSAMADAEAAAQEAQHHTPAGPLPREEELLALSEELERERRQLQEDEQTLMDQMREMEVGMAKERAEMARQRNDLQRLQSDIRHELERLEKNGALQSKIDSLKTKLQDVSTRRGAAPNQRTPANGAATAAPAPEAAATPAPKRRDSLMGRIFG